MKSPPCVRVVVNDIVRLASQNFCLSGYQCYHFARFMNHGKEYAKDKSFRAGAVQC
ncbi:hypothetical protein EDC54_102435 [Samsonia erythrinae]|uniref:Uncharacterized protein n=1 Tax=Samsonia erythrinae TaxID=160434 RepID=A0A4R3VQQ6_9GAMM|nr:hypothetical protein EDC54_102435 [Samsonia erythrinae]